MLQMYNVLKKFQRGLAASAVAAVLLVSGPAMADSGFYLGGSVGNTALEVNFDDGLGGVINIDFLVLATDAIRVISVKRYDGMIFGSANTENVQPSSAQPWFAPACTA